MELRGRQADVEVGAQRPRNVRGKELTQALAGDAPDHFADQVAVGQHVVARGRPGFPPGRLGGQQGGRLVPVVQVLEGDWLVPARDARGVRQELANLDLRLAPGRELGPVRATFASRSSSPRSTSTSAASEVMHLVVENTLVIVFSVHGTVRASSAQPPHRSTTISPSMLKASEAPRSSPDSSLAANSSRRGSKRAARAAQLPSGDRS